MDRTVFLDCSAAHKLNAKSAIIDGEAVVYGSGGPPDFQQLRRELGGKRSERVRYHAFDLLHLDGYDLRAAAYEHRKRLLQHLLKNAPETFIYVDAIEADGDEIFAKGCKLGLEGLVAKRLGHNARAGRRPGSSSNARRARRIRSWSSSRSSVPTRGRSPHST